MTVTIRPASEHDVETIYDISRAVHLTPFYKTLIPTESYPRFYAKYTPSEQGLQSYRLKTLARLKDPTWRLWVAEVDGAVVGYTVAQLRDEGLLLKGLFVDETYQGHGIGARLFAQSQQFAPTDTPIFLEVLRENGRAIGMYERAGFIKTGDTVKPFYGAPMIRMRKH